MLATATAVAAALLARLFVVAHVAAAGAATAAAHAGLHVSITTTGFRAARREVAYTTLVHESRATARWAGCIRSPGDAGVGMPATGCTVLPGTFGAIPFFFSFDNTTTAGRRVESLCERDHPRIVSARVNGSPVGTPAAPELNFRAQHQRGWFTVASVCARAPGGVGEMVVWFAGYAVGVRQACGAGFAAGVGVRATRVTGRGAAVRVDVAADARGGVYGVAVRAVQVSGEGRVAAGLADAAHAADAAAVVWRGEAVAMRVWTRCSGYGDAAGAVRVVVHMAPFAARTVRWGVACDGGDAMRGLFVGRRAWAADATRRSRSASASGGGSGSGSGTRGRTAVYVAWVGRGAVRVQVDGAATVRLRGGQARAVRVRGGGCAGRTVGVRRWGGGEVEVGVGGGGCAAARWVLCGCAAAAGVAAAGTAAWTAVWTAGRGTGGGRRRGAAWRLAAAL